MLNKAKEVLENYDIHSAFFYEAFVDSTSGKINWTYFCAANGEDLSVLHLKSIIKELNNGSDVFQAQNNKSDISKEEFFDKYYECCKFLIVRDWIRYLWLEENILLTKKDLFEWVSKAHPPKTFSYTDFTEFDKKVSYVDVSDSKESA